MDGIKCNTHTCTITYYAGDVDVLRNWCLKFEMSNCNGPHLEFFAVHSKKALVYLCYWHWSVLWNYLCNIGSSFVFFKLLNYTDVPCFIFDIDGPLNDSCVRPCIFRYLCHSPWNFCVSSQHGQILWIIVSPWSQAPNDRSFLKRILALALLSRRNDYSWRIHPTWHYQWYAQTAQL